MGNESSEREEILDSFFRYVIELLGLPYDAPMSEVLARLEATVADVQRYRTRKDEAFAERNKLVAILARIVSSAGGNAGRSIHQEVSGEQWDPEWRTLVSIDLPTGQASWHFHDRDAWLVRDLPWYKGEWDGHTSAEKYERVNRCSKLELTNAAHREEEIRRALVHYSMNKPARDFEHAAMLLVESVPRMARLYDLIQTIPVPPKET